MSIFVQRLDGTTSLHNFAPTVGMLRQVTGISSKLLAHGRILSDDAELHANTTLVEIGSLFGGKNKKTKKRVFKTPKHKPHRNKKIKLAVLKLYKLEKDNTVKRLKKACTNKKCGPACFMAQHKDRVTCGKCHTTLF